MSSAVNVIRPSVPPAPAPATPVDPSRLEAKRALFAEAFGRATASAQPGAPAPAPAAAPLQASQAAPASAAEAPRKILRPGSLLDIRV
jgi:hypothetical protein